MSGNESTAQLTQPTNLAGGQNSDGVEDFNHLSAFGIASALVPARKLQSLLAVEAQLEPLGDLLRDEPAPPLSLTSCREDGRR